MGFFDKLFGKALDSLCAPMAGKAVPVTEVPDPTFAEGMLGNGVAVIPTDGKVYAPCDATAPPWPGRSWGSIPSRSWA